MRIARRARRGAVTWADPGTARPRHCWHRIHCDLRNQTFVRAAPCSIVHPFDRITVRSNGYVAVVRRGSDIFATRRTDVWDLGREPLLSTQHARTRTRKVIRWRKPPWEAPQPVLLAPTQRRHPHPRA